MTSLGIVAEALEVDRKCMVSEGVPTLVDGDFTALAFEGLFDKIALFSGVFVFFGVTLGEFVILVVESFGVCFLIGLEMFSFVELMQLFCYLILLRFVLVLSFGENSHHGLTLVVLNSRSTAFKFLLLDI